MRRMMTNIARYAAAGMLIAVCAMAVMAMLAYYQEKVALVPAMIAGLSFMGAQMILDTPNKKCKKNGTEKVLPCGDGAE